MITTIFNQTALALVKAAQKLNLTYNEVNIIVYYMIVPLTWCIMLDFILSSWPWMSVVWHCCHTTAKPNSDQSSACST